jgi:8-oxo-dGTP pyrophosphatase MutT (NUDIX family)
MAGPRSVPRKISAGVILVDALGRVLLQLRDDDPKIMFPGHWGITGGAAEAGEKPEDSARREVAEETGIPLGRIEPFRAYYFAETATGARGSTKRGADYELYLFHALCETPAEEMVCGEGRELRFFSPHELPDLAVAYNHRDVLTDFFVSPIYARYLHGAADGAEDGAPVEGFVAALEAGDAWFDALMRAIALWEQPQETFAGREYRYLIGGEAFDWLLLAERLISEAPSLIPDDEAERLLFTAHAPADTTAPDGPRRVTDELLREAIGETKHRAHLNYVYGVIVEEALQYAVELEVSKEKVNVSIKDPRADEAQIDPVYERVYGHPRAVLLRDFREEAGLPHAAHISLSELREFLYWLFKYRVKNQEPARVASDTRKALAQLSAMEAAARRAARHRAEQMPAPPASDVLQPA